MEVRGEELVNDQDEVGRRPEAETQHRGRSKAKQPTHRGDEQGEGEAKTEGSAEPRPGRNQEQTHKTQNARTNTQS